MFHSYALKLAKKERKAYLLVALLATIVTVATIYQAWVLANIIHEIVVLQVPFDESLLLYLGLAIGIRMIAFHLQQQVSRAIGVRTHKELRETILSHMLGQGVRQKESAGQVMHLVTDGLDHVDAYMSQYMTQAIFSILIPLILSIAIISSISWVGWILLLTYPLIPFFMILIGKEAEKLNAKQWERMQFLGGHFLDVLQGLTTLKVFSRAKEQYHVIGRLSGEFRDATLKVLRVAFLSALVLELIGTISTAMIAVYLGVSLVYGEVDFLPAFFILLLAPDFYGPLRQLGSAFHTGMSGKVSFDAIQSYLQHDTTIIHEGHKELSSPIHSIAMEDLSYRYEENQYALCHITFTWEKGKSYMLVGESGAGKSTLSYIIMNLLEPTHGCIRVNGQDMRDLNSTWYKEQIAYVSQQPYIFSGTLRDNLCFGMNPSEEELEQTIEKIQLGEFIQSLPEGLNTIIGEDGFGLSGGQRQRIALGRALLRPAQILVLDEVTAHLDIETESLIMGILKELEQDKIVLYVGHRMQTMKYVDTLLVMKDGKLVESGTYADLVGQNGYFATLVNTYTNPMMKEELLQVDPTPVAPTNVIDSISKETIKENTVSYEPVDLGNVTSPRRRAIFSLLRLLCYDTFALCGSILFALGTVGMNVGLLMTSTWLITKAAEHPDLVVLSLAIVGVRFFGISRAICRYGERYVSHHVAFQGLYHLRLQFYKRIEPLVPRIFQTMKRGDLVGRIMADIETLQFFYLRTIVPTLAAVGLTVLLIVLGYYVHPLLGWTVGIYAFVVGLMLPFVTTWVVRHVPKERLRTRGQMKERLVESIHGVVDMIMSHQEKRLFQVVHSAFAAYERWDNRHERVVRWSDTLFLGFTQTSLIVGVIVGLMVVQDRAYDYLWVAVFAIGLQSYFEALQPMTNAFLHGHESVIAMERLESMECNHSVVSSKSMRKELSGTDEKGGYHGNSHKEIPMIHINHLSFAYTNVPIYEEFSLSIKKGEKVAIVGPSGSGKSTLFSLLQGWYGYEGTIEIDGNSITSYEEEDLRSYMSYATQDTYLFHGTIRDNILLAHPKATDEELWAAIEAVQLSQWIESLPHGLYTMVGSGEASVSGGQKQRIGMARLYLRKAPVILLDEPLEGLDQVTRHEVQQSLLNLCKHKTVLYITHHIEQLHEMDRIVFLEKGKIVEFGTYEELLSKRGRFYTYHRLGMERI